MYPIAASGVEIEVHGLLMLPFLSWILRASKDVADTSAVVAKTHLHKLWVGSGKRDVGAQPYRGMTLSHESYGVVVNESLYYS